MPDPTAPALPSPGAVRAEPVLAVVVRLLPLWLAWLVVVVLGRRVCWVAQRLPPVVRWVRRRREEPLRPGAAP